MVAGDVEVVDPVMVIDAPDRVAGLRETSAIV